MNWELVSTLPPGSGSRTVLARLGARFGVLRQLETEPFYPPRTKGSTLPLLEVAVVAGLRYGVYEVVSTVSLRELTQALLEAEQMPPVGMVAKVLIDAARAVASIAPPRAHGGLSDASVLVGFDGTTRLLDFGAPRTSRFLAPGRPSGPNDVFALGAVMHSALTGFTGHYGEAVVQGLKLPPPSLSNSEVPTALDEILERATSGHETDRPADAAQFADEVEKAMAGALFSLGDIAAVVGMALPTQREELARLLAGDPVPVISPAPSPARVRGKPTPPPMVPWPLEDTQPLAIAMPRGPALPLDEDEPTEPGGWSLAEIAGPPVIALPEPKRPLAPAQDSKPSMPALPIMVPSADPPPRGSRGRKVLAAVLAALALLAVGVHELAPEVINSIRARLGAAPRRARVQDLEDRSSPAQSKLTDENLTRPAREREPVVNDETVVSPR